MTERATPQRLFTEPESGLFLVAYREDGDLSPANNQPLVDQLRASAKALGHRVAVIFDVGPQIGWVDISVPSFWLSVTGADDCPIGAMGIVTRAAGVRVAAKGFMLANRYRKVDIEVQTFEDTLAALAWAREKRLR